MRTRKGAAARHSPVAPTRSAGLATRVHERIKGEIFDFCLMPGDRFTESEVASRMQVSRTPVREALYRLESEGYLEVMFRSGWRVRPFDFQLFENLYDVRVVLEIAAVGIGDKKRQSDEKPEQLTVSPDIAPIVECRTIRFYE